MDVARSAPQGAHYHADVIYLLSKLGKKEGSRSLMVLRVKPTPTRFPTNSIYTPMDSTPSHLPRLDPYTRNLRQLPFLKKSANRIC